MKNVTNISLIEERKRRQWSQQEIATLLGTTQHNISRWERGVTMPGPYFRTKLCALLGKSAQQLGLAAGNTLPAILPERDISQETPMASSAPEKPTLWTVPYRRNLYFTGRDDLFHLLDQHLSATRQGEETPISHVALTQPQAIKGLGGIGKTQIAVEYAYRAREQEIYTHTLWINAASQEALMSSFTGLAAVLPAFPATEKTNQQKLVATIKRWLEQCRERWLLIFDNVDDLSLVQEYMPHAGNGNILLTTRANAVGSLAVSIDVEKMGFVEGTHLLLRRAQRFAHASDDEINEAGNIVVALDHFPLALEQAGAYIEETGCSFENYLHLYQNHQGILLARRGAQSTNYPDSVATTWSLSFRKVEQTNPAAAELLQLCAFLAPDHIPEELLMDAAQQWPTYLQQAVTDRVAFDQMLEALLSFSLVKRMTENHLLSIHRLVQVVQLDRMDLEEQHQWAKRIVYAVNMVFPRDPRNEIASWPQCLRYLEQAQVCNTLIQELMLKLTEGADLLNRTGRYLYEHASYAIAEPLYRRALSVFEQDLGPEHPQVASTLNNLAELYREQGMYAVAEPLFQRALRIFEQSLGLEHPQVASTLNSLAELYWVQGKFIEAEPLYQRALRIREQSLGLEHLDVASTLNNLAVLYKMQGKYTAAEPLYQRALRIREQSLGLEHPNMASLLSNLALLYSEQGKYTEAEPLYQRALRIFEQSLGTEHPNMGFLLSNLALLYSEQGKYMEAERLYQRALCIREQSLGPGHLDVASPLHNLAVLYKMQGKDTEAEPLYQRALRIWEQSLGRMHPNVASPLTRLADLYRERGEYTEAEPLYQRALCIFEQSLGPTHRNVASPLTGLANLYREQRKYPEAESLYQRALHIFEQSLGPTHPHLAFPLTGLANLYREQRKYSEAESLYQRALHIREHALEPKHPDLAETLHDFATLRERQGKIGQAVSLYDRALQIREQVYGTEHPKTIETHERFRTVSTLLSRTEEVATSNTSHQEHDV